MAVSLGSSMPAMMIERYNGGDFNIFSMRLKMALTAHSVWAVVSGDEKKPEGTDAKEWIQRNDKALGIIASALSDAVLLGSGVAACETAREAWQKLQDAYAKKTTTSKLLLREQFTQLQMREEESVQQYINRVNALVDTMAAAGVTYDEEEVVSRVLLSLPAQFAPLVTALENMEESKLTRSYILSRLLHEEQKQQQHSERTRSSAMLAYRGAPPRQQQPQQQQPHYQPQQRRTRGPVTCFYCDKTGHVVRDCPEKKAAVAQRSRNAHVHAAAAAAPDTALAAAPSDNHDVYLFAAGGTPCKNDWLVDSGASEHMCNDRTAFSTYERIVPRDVTVGDGAAIKAVGRGTVMLRMQVDGAEHTTTLTSVLHVPEMRCNLFSVGRAMERGYRCEFGEKQCRILTAGGIAVALGALQAGVFRLQCSRDVTASAAVATATPTETELWHQRLGHAPLKTIKMASTMITGVNKVDDSYDFCIACAQGKQHASPVAQQATTRATEPLQLVHSDVCGPMQTASHAGHRYFISFIDDYSRRTWAVPLTQKSDAIRAFTAFKATVEKQTGKSLRVLRSDNGGEYESREFTELLQQSGIVHQRSAPHTPEQNGVAERSNRSIVEIARTLLHAAGLSYEFWPEAVAVAVYLKNRLPHRAVTGKTPEEAFTGIKPDVSHLRVFGCDAYVLVPEGERRKLDSKVKRCIFVGYGHDQGVLGYRLYDPATRKFIMSRNVSFNERSMGNARGSTEGEETARKAAEVELLLMPLETDRPTAEKDGPVSSGPQAAAAAHGRAVAARGRCICTNTET